MASSIIDEFMKGGQGLYKNRDQSAMMRDIIDLIGINLKFAKRLMAKGEPPNRIEDMDVESKEQLNGIVTSGNSVISSVLENINNAVEKE